MQKAPARSLGPGFRLFIAGHFFEAHEAWEEVWHLEPEGPRRERIQGLIQVAAGLHKGLRQKNAGGAVYLLRRGLKKIAFSFFR